MISVKICGITNERDYRAAVSYGADYIGFIFYPGSLRYISMESAREIIAENRSENVLNVGVFVDESPARVREIYWSAGLDLVQLHGEESAKYCDELFLPHWKAFRIRELDIVSRNNPDDYECPILLDTWSADEPGGTGKSFNWRAAERFMRRGRRIFLSGGLSPENIRRAASLKPHGVDIGSSIEKIPGEKDLNKMRKLFEEIKEVNYV